MHYFSLFDECKFYYDDAPFAIWTLVCVCAFSIIQNFILKEKYKYNSYPYCMYYIGIVCAHVWCIKHLRNQLLDVCR